jgi:hypothetical protein
MNKPILCSACLLEVKCGENGASVELLIQNGFNVISEEEL